MYVVTQAIPDLAIAASTLAPSAYCPTRAHSKSTNSTLRELQRTKHFEMKRKPEDNTQLTA